VSDKYRAATTADVNRRHAAMNLGKRYAVERRARRSLFSLVACGASLTACFASTCRDRTRGALFGNVEAEDMSHYDPEKLERANDAEIDTLGERAKHLKQVGCQSACFHGSSGETESRWLHR
jgi:hypothetical protein